MALTLTSAKKLDMLQDDERRELGEGEITVRMKYASVQPWDTIAFNAELPHVQLPQVLGAEGVGIVEASNCEAFPTGAQVAFLFRRPCIEFGCWRTLVTLDPSRACIASVPYDLEPQVAAAGITSTFMALTCLRHFKRGASIVVTGAGGAVGSATVQLAAYKGMKAIGLVRGCDRVAKLSAEFSDYAKSISFVDVTAPCWFEMLMELCNENVNGVNGVDGIVDGVGTDVFLKLALDAVYPHGQVITYGAHGSSVESADLTAAIEAKHLVHREENISKIIECADADSQFRQCISLMAARKYRPQCWEITRWEHAAECLQPQPEWSEFLHASLFTEGRIGRNLLKFL